jgi:hypothetical protein
MAGSAETHRGVLIAALNGPRVALVARRDA